MDNPWNVSATAQQMKRDHWIQTGILVATLLTLALGAWQNSKASAEDISARFARIEQRLDDRDKDMSEMLESIKRIEANLK